MVTISGNSDGNTATYTCDQGYELVGAETLTCQSIGAQWSDPPPVCQLIGKKVIVPRIIMIIYYDRDLVIHIFKLF